MGLLPIVDRSWPVLTRLMSGHAWIYRATGGRLGHRLPGVPPFCLLDHTGARTGRKRTTPLIYVENGGTLFVVASKGGYERNPAWFHNLMASPDTTVQIGSGRRPVHARKANPQERERLWPKAVATYPSYAEYARRTDREIPLVILEPR